MAASVFATCSDGCGWAGAVIAPFAFGSFGVPLKTSVKVEVDALVMQVRHAMVTCAFRAFLSFVSLTISATLSLAVLQDYGVLSHVLASHFDGYVGCKPL